MKKVLFCLVLSLRFLGLSSQEAGQGVTFVKPDSTAVENGILDAVALIDAREVAAARNLLDSLARVSPDNDAVCYYLGMCRFNQGDVEGAMKSIEKASALDSANVWYRETLASLYLNTGRTPEALSLYRRLQKERPAKYPDIFINSLAADSYRLSRDYPAFFKALTALVQDENADDEMKYSALMSSLGNFDSRTFNAILPSLDSLMVRYCEAEPSSLHAHNLRLETAIGRDDSEAVIRECRTLIALQPDDPGQQVTCLAIIGDTYHSLGNEKLAFKTYEEALKIDPSNCPVLNNYAYYLSQRRCRLRKAEKMSRITVEKEPDNATYLDTYGWILYLRGRAAEAKPYFKHAMIYGGKESAVILEHYSLVLKKLGEEDLSAYYHNLAESKKK